MYALNRSQRLHAQQHLLLYPMAEALPQQALITMPTYLSIHLSLSYNAHALHFLMHVRVDFFMNAGHLEFHNNFAVNKAVSAMPDKSFSVELWARGGEVETDAKRRDTQQHRANLVSYATQTHDAEGYPTGFMDDAIRIERVKSEPGLTFFDSDEGGGAFGAVAVYINSNENTDSPSAQSWMIFDARWLDDDWHHVAVTWDQASGTTRCYMDGAPVTPVLKSDRGMWEHKAADQGGVDATLAAGSSRGTSGSLVLAQVCKCTPYTLGWARNSIVGGRLARWYINRLSPFPTACLLCLFVPGPRLLRRLLFAI